MMCARLNQARPMSELNLPQLRQPRPGLLTSGVVTPEQIAEIAAHGIRTVVNLCPPAETGWDEAAAVTGQGMRYVNIPVAGPQDLAPEKARELAAIAAGSENQPVLVHCRSSNRVGALFAIAAWLDGASSEDALARGREAGLTALEPAVQAILPTLAQDAP